MRITVTRTGGYAGTERVADVDTAHLDPARARAIEQMARDAAGDAGRTEEVIGADLMRYEIIIQDNGSSRRLSWTDDGNPQGGPVKRLIEEVGLNS